MSKWQVCCPTGHHRFGFSSRHHKLDKYEPVSPLQMVARRNRCTRPSFNSSERSTSQRNNLRTSGHQRATNFFQICALDRLDQMATCTRSARKTSLLPPTKTTASLCHSHLSALFATKFQLDAGRRSALLLSSQRVKPHFVAESLITSTVKDALSRTPREKFPATGVRIRPRDQPEPDLTTEEARRLIASLRQMHTNLGHPSNHALARAIRVTGGSAAAVRAALQLRCDVCESHQHPGPPLASETSHRQGVW